MRYIWTEDTGAGLHFWNLVNQILFDNKIVIESKASNQSRYFGCVGRFENERG